MARSTPRNAGVGGRPAKKIVPEEHWDRIGEQLLGELERRLSDPDEVTRIPGTVLMRLGEQYMKFLDKRTQTGGDTEILKSPLETIDQEGLPAVSKLAILDRYLATINEEHEHVTQKRAEVAKELDAGLQKMHGQKPSPPRKQVAPPKRVMPLLRKPDEPVLETPESVHPEQPLVQSG